MKRFLVVFGTRPSAVKLAPVVHALESREAVVHVCLTGQHGDMLDCCLEPLGLKVDFRFDDCPRVGSLADKLAAIVGYVSSVITGTHASIGRYDGVIVVGDTISGMAGALAGTFSDVPVAHVEAGLRTYDREPWPEETIRRAIDSMAAWCFAPTKLAMSNLWAEGNAGDQLLVGNTVVDSLRRMGVERKPHELVLVTLHRRENWEHMLKLASSIKRLATINPDITFTWPVHPNPRIWRDVELECGLVPNISLVEPMPYDVFLPTLASAKLVITDSGGVQEESAVLGVPSIVVRQNTERPEAIAAGVSTLISPYQLLEIANDLLSYPGKLASASKPCTAFGDGRAGERIADILLTGKTEIEVPAC